MTAGVPRACRACNMKRSLPLESRSPKISSSPTVHTHGPAAIAEELLALPRVCCCAAAGSTPHREAVVVTARARPAPTLRTRCGIVAMQLTGPCAAPLDAKPQAARLSAPGAPPARRGLTCKPTPRFSADGSLQPTPPRRLYGSRIHPDGWWQPAQWQQTGCEAGCCVAGFRSRPRQHSRLLEPDHCRRLWEMPCLLQLAMKAVYPPMTV